MKLFGIAAIGLGFLTGAGHAQQLMCTRNGDQSFCSDGTMYQHVGPNALGSDGSMIQQQGPVTYYTPSQRFQPGVSGCPYLNLPVPCR